jgi:NADH:ubiquinone oxidoreductase subunit E
MSSIQKILLQFAPKAENLLPALKKIQKEHKYLSKEHCAEVAEYFSLPPARVFEVASFFDELKTEKPAKKVIRVCLGGPCLSKKSAKIVRQIEMFLKIEIENDAHPKWKLEYMSCRGICDRGPVVEVDGQIFEKVRAEIVDDLLRDYL